MNPIIGLRNYLKTSIFYMAYSLGKLSLFSDLTFLKTRVYLERMLVAELLYHRAM